MKILLGTFFLNVPRGTETWTYTLAINLKKRGHEVHVLTAEAGIIAGYLSQFGIKVFNRRLEKENYDLAIINHNFILNFIKQAQEQGLVNKMPIVCFLHGIKPDLEQPVQGADFYVAISEEVKNHAQGKGFKVHDIIYNFVDLQRFKRETSLNPFPKTIFYLSNYQTVVNELVKVCRRRGIELITSRNAGCGMWVEKVMAKSDIVVSLGRGVYEGLAMGNAVIVGDHSIFIGGAYTDGMINSKAKFLESVKFNCNSKRFKRPFKAGPILNEIVETYNPSLQKLSRDIAEEYLDVNKAIDRILNFI